MRRSAEDGWPDKDEPLAVYHRAGLPCRRCGTPVAARGLGNDNRTAYWCPGCQS